MPPIWINFVAMANENPVSMVNCLASFNPCAAHVTEIPVGGWIQSLPGDSISSNIILLLLIGIVVEAGFPNRDLSIVVDVSHGVDCRVRFKLFLALRDT
jgi:hypothetical protein